MAFQTPFRKGSFEDGTGRDLQRLRKSTDGDRNSSDGHRWKIIPNAPVCAQVLPRLPLASLLLCQWDVT